jgi:hypothetical protein
VFFLQHHDGKGAGAAMTGSARRTRVVIRFYSGDSRRHAYLAEEVAAAVNYHQLHPLCHRSLGYHLGHPADMISPVQFRDLGGVFEACGSCVLWLRQNPHEILVDNEIAAVRGILPIPAPRSVRRERAVAASADVTGRFARSDLAPAVRA